MSRLPVVTVLLASCIGGAAWAQAHKASGCVAPLEEGDEEVCLFQLGSNPRSPAVVMQGGAGDLLLRSHQPGFEVATGADAGFKSRYTVAINFGTDGKVTSGQTRFLGTGEGGYDEVELHEVTVALDAMPGPRTVIATISPKGAESFNQVWTMPSLLHVSQSPLTKISQVTPSKIHAGAEEVPVDIAADNTHFDTLTTVSFPATSGAKGTGTLAPSPGVLRTNVSIPHFVPPGALPMAVITDGGGYEEVSSSIEVLAPLPLAVTPRDVQPGATQTLTLEATGTEFLTDAPRVVFLAEGFEVKSVTATSNTTATAVVEVLPNAPADVDVGVKVVSGSKAAVALAALDVHVPRLKLAPASGEQGSEVTFTVEAQDATFVDPPQLTVSGAGVEVAQLSRSAPGKLTGTLRIGAGAEPGMREVAGQTTAGQVIASSGFKVVASSEAGRGGGCGCAAADGGGAWALVAGALFGWGTVQGRRRRGARRTRRNARGFTLMEMMIAGAILAVGMLGSISLVIATSRTQSLAQQRRIANGLAQRYSERLSSMPVSTVAGMAEGTNVFGNWFDLRCFRAQGETLLEIACPAEGDQLEPFEFAAELRVSGALCGACGASCVCPALPNVDLRRALVHLTYDMARFDLDPGGPLTAAQWADPCAAVRASAERDAETRTVCVTVDRRQ